MEEKEYQLYCEVCSTETKILVLDCDEVPAFCPMCGTESEVEAVENEEDDI